MSVWQSGCVLAADVDVWAPAPLRGFVLVTSAVNVCSQLWSRRSLFQPYNFLCEIGHRNRHVSSPCHRGGLPRVRWVTVSKDRYHQADDIHGLYVPFFTYRSSLCSIRGETFWEALSSMKDQNNLTFVVG